MPTTNTPTYSTPPTMTHRPLLLVALLLSLLTSCVRTQYVPIEVRSITRDTLRQTLIHRDTLRTSDTILIDRYREGDTVYVNRTQTHYRDRISLRHDTVYIARTDTLTRMPEALKASTISPTRRNYRWPIIALSILFAITLSILLPILAKRRT